MKKGLYAALFSATIASCALRYSPPPTLPSSITQISTPEETKQWLENVLTYEHDEVLYRKRDFWAPCALTYKLKQGDCEDYAICAAAILDRDVEEGYIITTYDSKTNSAHAVFAFRLHGKWGMISNNESEFRNPRYESLHGVLLSSFSEKYTEYFIYDYQGIDLINGNEDLESKMKQVGNHPLENFAKKR